MKERWLALGKAVSNQSTAELISRVQSVKVLDFNNTDSPAASGPPPPSWKTVDLSANEDVGCSPSYTHAVVGALSPSQSSIDFSLTQCPMFVTSSISTSETEDFSTPCSASVGVGLGVSAGSADRSTLAMAQVDKVLLGLWKSSAFAVS